MGTEKSVSGPFPPPLVVHVQGHDRSLPGNRSYLVGRDPRCDIVVTDDRVSWHHAALQPQGDRWVLVDNNSTNGTYADGQRVARVEIGTECVARLGHPADGPVLSCAIAGTGQAEPGGPSAHPGTGAAAGSGPGRTSVASPAVAPVPGWADGPPGPAWPVPAIVQLRTGPSAGWPRRATHSVPISTRATRRPSA